MVDALQIALWGRGRGSVQWHASLERSNGSTTRRDLASSRGRADRRVRCNWRAHAQATSERVQSRSGTFSHQQRPQRISAQLSLLLGIDRAWSETGAPTAIHARDFTL